MNNLKRYLEITNKKQNDIANVLGISKTAVSNQIKKGITNTKTAKKYAKVLNCPALWILDF